jgi:hypothetical protein
LFAACVIAKIASSVETWNNFTSQQSWQSPFRLQTSLSCAIKVN